MGNRPSKLLFGLNGVALCLLLATLAYGSAEMVQSQLLRWGESFFPGYHELRADVVEPTCNVNLLQGELAALDQPKTEIAPDRDELDDLLFEPSENKAVGDELDDLVTEACDLMGQSRDMLRSQLREHMYCSPCPLHCSWPPLPPRAAPTRSAPRAAGRSWRNFPRKP